MTNVALGAVRALDYASIALVLGPLAFLLALTPPALRGGPFERAVRRLLVAGLALGVIGGVLGIALSAAHESGRSLWTVPSSALSHVLASRFGWVWATRTMLFATSLAALRLPRGRLFSAWFVLVGAAAAVSPALSGHAAVQSPVWVFFPSDVAHVLAAGTWVGGVTCLVVALPAALRGVEASSRTRMTIEVLARFSPVALGAVAAIAITGVVQAYIEIRTVGALTHTTYGELVLLKIGLLGLLIGLGAINRERVIPTLRRAHAAGSPAAHAGVMAARTTRGELVAMACVFAVTAALLAYTPPVQRPGVRAARAGTTTPAARSDRRPARV